MKLDISIGRPVTRDGITLFPLYNHQAPAPEYVPGPRAEAAGALVVEELDHAEVPELVVGNRGDRPALLVEGETVLGNRQNRTLNVSVLVGAGAKVPVPVSCVEEGRWGAPQRAGLSSFHAPVNLRSRKTRSVAAEVKHSGVRRSDQDAVWDEVRRNAHHYAVAAPTMAIEDVHRAAASSRRGLRELRPLREQAGAVVVTGGRVRMAELFDKPATLDTYWDRLVAGYALDPGDSGDREDRQVKVDEVLAFLRFVEKAPVTEAETAGLGRELHFASRAVHGTALAWERGLVHLSAFAAA